jgi:hypothetical protein
MEAFEIRNKCSCVYIDISTLTWPTEYRENLFYFSCKDTTVACRDYKRNDNTNNHARQRQRLVTSLSFFFIYRDIILLYLRLQNMAFKLPSLLGCNCICILLLTRAYWRGDKHTKKKSIINTLQWSFVVFFFCLLDIFFFEKKTQRRQYSWSIPIHIIWRQPSLLTNIQTHLHMQKKWICS